MNKNTSMKFGENRFRRGFTLIELLTVIAIIGILAAILIPVVGRVRASARTAQCISNLRQIHMAFFLYADDNNGLLPYGGNRNYVQFRDRQQLVRWNGAVFPYMAETGSMDAAARDVFLFDFSANSPTVFKCPSVAEDHSGYHFKTNINVTPGGQQRSVSHFESSVVLATDAGGQGPPSSFLLNPASDSTLYAASGVSLRHNDRANVVYMGGHVGTQARNDLPPVAEDADLALVLWGVDPARRGR